MKVPSNFGEILTAWVEKERSVSGLILIGSRERAQTDAIWRADDQSDWDFHLITSDPNIFLTNDWTKELHGIDLRVYAARMTRIGSVPKINAIFSDTEVDLVIIPSRIVRFARMLTKIGWHRRPGKIRQFLQDLAVVIRPGFRCLKDTGNWESFYRFAVNAVADTRVGNEAAKKLADGFACDYIWAIRKIARGEYFAAQRMLHRELMETNFRLLHELRLRRGDRSFPEARRIEMLASQDELTALSATCTLNSSGLTAAIEKAAQTCRALMKDLVGDEWKWPNLEG